MSSVFAILALGFFLGVRHATDPDHVIAVTTLVARHRRIRDAALIGVWWGVGHTLTIFVVGGVIILFSIVIPPRVGLSMELSVAFMLILLGVLNLRGFRRYRSVAAGDAATEVQGEVQVHPHQHPDETPLGWLDRRLGRTRPYRALRPLVVGVVHGLAGSAAVALMILAVITDRRWAMLYLLVFGAGTILGMMLLTGVIAVPFKYAGERSTRLRGRLAVSSGLLSLGVGLVLAYQLVWVNGLFTGSPTWTPH